MPAFMNNLWESYLKNNNVLRVREFLLPPLSLAIIFLSVYLFNNQSMNFHLKPSFSILAPQSHYPVGALKWMEKNNFRGNILPDFDWGEFIIWSCYPHCKVAMDGRYETVYNENLIRQYFNFSAGQDGWDGFLKKYPHDLILIKSFTKPHFLLLKNPSWKVGYLDKQSVLFVRNNPS